MTDKKLSSPAQAEVPPARLKWKLVAVIVGAAHLAMLAGLDRLMPFLAPDNDADDASALAVQMVTPVAPPPSLPKPSLAPASPVGVVAEPQASQPAPSVKEPQTDDFRSDQELAPAVDLSGRIPRAEELPRVGGVTMTLWWGDHTAGSQIGRGVISLSFPAPDQYELKMTSVAMGWAALIVRNPLNAEASGTIGPGGFRPSRYAHRTPTGKEEISVFDYEKEKISYSSLKEPLPLPKGVQDRLSFMLQLAWMLKVSPEQFSLGQSVVLPMASRNKVEDVSFTVMADQDIVMPGGVLVPALHVSSFRKGERFKGQIDVWFDKTDRLLPVRIRFEESRGQILDMLTARQ